MKTNNLNHKIETILRDDDLLQGFNFFFNKAENFRIASSVIKQVLEKFDSNTNKREILKYEDKIAFLDVFKIEAIYDAVVNKSAMKLPITLQEFKEKYQQNLLKKDAWAEKYREFTTLYKEEDEIFEAVSPRWTWKQLCGRSFVVLQRRGETLAAIRKSMN